MPDHLAILILAAGASSRMRGKDKLLQDIDGEPLLRRVTQIAIETGGRVYVALPAADHPRSRQISGARPIWVPDAQEGMAASIRAGVTGLPQETEGVAILPADMPDITTEDLQRIRAAFAGPDGPIIRAAGQGRAGQLQPGHPVVFPKRCFAELMQLRGDTGARKLLASDPPVLVTLPRQNALTDLDTPEAWERWHTAREGQS